MSWDAVARKDVRDAARAKSVWLLVAVFLVLFVGLAYAVPELGSTEFDAFLSISASVVGLVLPLIGITLGYKAVIAERESGSMALLLSMPHSRRDVVFGKFVGRSIVLAVPTLIGLAAAIPVVLVRYDAFEPVQYLGFAALTLLYGLAFLGISIGLSASTTVSRRVTGGAFAAYVGLVMFWTTLVDIAVVMLFRFQPDALVNPPDWVPLAKLLDPSTAYAYLIADGIGSGVDPPLAALDEQWFTSPAVALVLVLAWIAVPLVLGYRRFDRTDL